MKRDFLETEWIPIHNTTPGIPIAIKFTSGRFQIKNLKFDTKFPPMMKEMGMRFTNSGKFWYSKMTVMLVLTFLEKFPEAKVYTENLGIDFTEISVHPDYKPSDYLMEHQKRSALIALERKRFGFFHDTGVGKTLLGIEIHKQRRARTFVVCPLAVISDAWISDIKKFSPEIKAVNMWRLFKKKDTKKGKMMMRYAIENGDIFIVNFEAFRNNVGFFKTLDIQILMIDESSKMKNVKSKITNAIIDYGEDIPYCYLFSGTPAPNNYLEYWPQIRLIDAAVFTRSFYVFRNVYFNETGYGNYIYKIKPEMEQRFLRKLSEHSEAISKDDVLDLPEQTFNVRKVFLSGPEAKAYKEMEKHFITEIEEKEVVASNAAVKMMKLREGTSGFFIYDDGKIVKSGRTKLDYLIELLEEIGSHQAIIWFNFDYEGDQISKEIENINKTFCRIDGTVSNQTDKDYMLENFKAGKIQYLLSKPSSLGHGVTLVNTSYAIYFSLSYSYETFKQSQDRIYRKGQTRPCAYYFIIADNSIDEALMACLKDKGRIANYVLDYIKSRRRKENEEWWG